MRATSLSLLLVALLLPTGAAAEHGSPWLVALPSPGQPLPRNGALTLRAENGPHPVVVRPQAHRYRLVADGDVVPLTPLHLGHGDDWDGYGTSYLRLEAARALRARTVYRLEVRRGGGAWTQPHIAAPFSHPTATYGGPQSEASWTTTARGDGLAPRWRAPPRITRGEYGPRLDAEVEDANVVGFHVRARHRGAPAIDVVTAHAPVFGVHDGCATVILPAIGTYRLRITPLDAAGNRGRTHSLPVRADVTYANLLVCLAEPASP